jgi:hypothetical protein
MNENVARPIPLAPEPPAFELNRNAHRIASDQEALAVARELAADFVREKLFGRGPRLPNTHVGARYRNLASLQPALEAAE